MLVKNHKCFDDQQTTHALGGGISEKEGGFTFLSREHLVTEQRRGEHYNRSGQESPAGSGHRVPFRPPLLHSYPVESPPRAALLATKPTAAPSVLTHTVHTHAAADALYCLLLPHPESEWRTHLAYKHIGTNGSIDRGDDAFNEY